ncbi:unnamed protein product [Closterium sp. Naga37s-1]|nr:unnamed protein product [Closterium sp. Naga37s-1]
MGLRLLEQSQYLMVKLLLDCVDRDTHFSHNPLALPRTNASGSAEPEASAARSFLLGFALIACAHVPADLPSWFQLSASTGSSSGQLSAGGSSKGQSAFLAAGEGGGRGSAAREAMRAALVDRAGPSAARFALAAIHETDAAFPEASCGEHDEEWHSQAAAVAAEEVEAGAGGEVVRGVKGRLWANVFEYAVQGGQYDEAFCALASNPDPLTRSICLRQFVAVLCDMASSAVAAAIAATGVTAGTAAGRTAAVQTAASAASAAAEAAAAAEAERAGRALSTLCDRSLPYAAADLHVQVQQELMWLAENSDVALSLPLSTSAALGRVSPYKLLYSFHVARSDWRKAALSMYRYAWRLGREVLGTSSSNSNRTAPTPTPAASAASAGSADRRRKQRLSPGYHQPSPGRVFSPVGKGSPGMTLGAERIPEVKLSAVRLREVSLAVAIQALELMVVGGEGRGGGGEGLRGGGKMKDVGRGGESVGVEGGRGGVGREGGWGEEEEGERQEAWLPPMVSVFPLRGAAADADGVGGDGDGASGGGVGGGGRGGLREGGWMGESGRKRGEWGYWREASPAKRGRWGGETGGGTSLGRGTEPVGLEDLQREHALVAAQSLLATCPGTTAALLDHIPSSWTHNARALPTRPARLMRLDAQPSLPLLAPPPSPSLSSPLPLVCTPPYLRQTPHRTPAAPPHHIMSAGAYSALFPPTRAFYHMPLLPFVLASPSSPPPASDASPQHIISACAHNAIFPQALHLATLFFSGSQRAAELSAILSAAARRCCMVQLGLSPAARDLNSISSPAPAATSAHASATAAADVASSPALMWQQMQVWTETYVRHHPNLREVVARAILGTNPALPLPPWLIRLFLEGSSSLSSLPPSSNLLPFAFAPSSLSSPSFLAPLSTPFNPSIAPPIAPDPSSLLRVYLDFNHLIQASRLALAMLRAWRAVRSADPRTAKQRMGATWQPHALLDRLRLQLAAAAAVAEEGERGKGASGRGGGGGRAGVSVGEGEYEVVCAMQGEVEAAVRAYLGQVDLDGEDYRQVATGGAGGARKGSQALGSGAGGGGESAAGAAGAGGRLQTAAFGAAPAFGSAPIGSAPGFGAKLAHTGAASVTLAGGGGGGAAAAASVTAEAAGAGAATGGSVFGRLGAGFGSPHASPPAAAPSAAPPAAPSAAPLFGGAGSTFGGAGSTFGGAGSTFGGVGSTFGGAGSTFGGAGSTFGGAGSTFGGPGSTFGGAGSTFGVRGDGEKNTEADGGGKAGGAAGAGGAGAAGAVGLGSSAGGFGSRSGDAGSGGFGGGAGKTEGGNGGGGQGTGFGGFGATTGGGFTGGFGAGSGGFGAGGSGIGAGAGGFGAGTGGFGAGTGGFGAGAGGFGAGTGAFGAGGGGFGGGSVGFGTAAGGSSSGFGDAFGSTAHK